VAETELHLRPRNELVRFAKTKALAMRNANTGNPDAVQVSVRGQHTDGRYIVRRDHWPMDILVPASPRDAVIPYPRRMPMGFEDGSPQKPVLYWLQRRPVPALGPLGSSPSFFAAWWRHAVRMAYRFFASVWDDVAEPDSEIVFSPTGLTATGTIIRTDADGIVYWADVADMNTLDLVADGPTGTATATDLGGEITSLCLGEITGRSYCTVQGFVDTSGAECALGYAAGVAVSDAAEAEITAQGAADFAAEACDASDRANNFLADNPPDMGESEEWRACYDDGLKTRYIEIYSAEGCPSP
jgi:hypothetical protein